MGIPRTFGLGSHLKILKQDTIQQYMTRALNRTSSTELEPDTVDDEDDYEDGGSREEFLAWLDAPAGSPFPGPRTRDLNPDPDPAPAVLAIEAAHAAPAAAIPEPAFIEQACTKCKKSPCN